MAGSRHRDDGEYVGSEYVGSGRSAGPKKEIIPARIRKLDGYYSDRSDAVSNSYVHRSSDIGDLNEYCFTGETAWVIAVS